MEQVVWMWYAILMAQIRTFNFHHSPSDVFCCLDMVSTDKLRKIALFQQDLRSVILDTPRGEDIVEALDRDSLTNKQRKELTRILVSHLMVLHGSR